MSVWALENKTNVKVKVESGLLNQFCGDFFFFFLHITLPEKHFVLYPIFRITEFQSYICLFITHRLYSNSESEGTSLG